MPGCMLRICGKEFDSTRAAQNCSLSHFDDWQRGEKRWERSQRIHEDSGISFLVSDADGGHVAVKVSDAINFVTVHDAELIKLVSADGVEHAYLDFGWNFYERTPAQWNFFPSELLGHCAKLGLSICVSVYATSSECDDNMLGQSGTGDVARQGIQDAN